MVLMLDVSLSVGGGEEGHDKLCKLFWRANSFSAPGINGEGLSKTCRPK